MRADQWLVERGLAASRSQAQRLIAAGARWLSPSGWKTLAKSDELPPHAEVELLDAAEARYVSRGGLKLEGALRATGLQVTGWHGLDVGQSTGGFTDCLLQAGAAKVVGVEVGHDQLHPRLRADGRCVTFEGLNARQLGAAELGEHYPPQGFDLLVCDASFISLALLLPQWAALLAPAGHVLALVKPQFEVGPQGLGKGGIVRDPVRYTEVEARLRAAADTAGLIILDWFDSPITGGDGNREFFFHAIRRPGGDTHRSKP